MGSATEAVVKNGYIDSDGLGQVVPGSEVRFGCSMY